MMETREDIRFIPVHTGNISSSLEVANKVAVYPCAYREHVAILAETRPDNRFIPVHTGNMW